MTQPLSQKKRVMQVFESNPGMNLTPKDIVKQTQIKEGNVYKYIKELADHGEIKKTGRGIYVYESEIKEETPESVRKSIQTEDDLFEILNKVDKHIYHRTFDLIELLPYDSKRIEKLNRNQIRNIIIETILFTLNIKLDPKDRNKFIEYLRRSTE